MSKRPTEKDLYFVSGEYIGECNGYQLYRNKDGFIEGYKGDYDKIKEKGTIDRIVTNTTKVENFPNFIKRNTPVIKKYNPYKDSKQLKIE
jgi:hypothetical protein